jgi:hypothetical protein
LPDCRSPDSRRRKAKEFVFVTLTAEYKEAPPTVRRFERGQQAAVVTELLYRLAQRNFAAFCLTIGRPAVAKIEGAYVWGEHIGDMARRLQGSQHTATQAFRISSKSVTARLYLLWLLWTTKTDRREYSYFSYKQELGGHHITKAKQYLEEMPIFADYESLSDAQTIMRYRTPEGGVFECTPEGILAFKRGIHKEGVILDDVLKDPTQSLDLRQIERITRVVQEEVMSIPKDGGFFHLLGTPQDTTDLFAVLRENPMFDWAAYPAERETPDGKRVAIWPEVFSIAKLDKIKQRIGPKAYQKEYLLFPVRSAEGFFMEPEIRACLRAGKGLAPGLKGAKAYGLPADAEVYAAADLGKKRHPSHLSVIAKIWNREAVPMDDGTVTQARTNYTLRQLVSRWFDGVPYTKQLVYFRKAIESFGIRRFLYDNTRAELEALGEQGALPKAMVPVTASSRTNWEMASAFDVAVNRGQLELVEDERQIRQILLVDNNLKAPETNEGHGDSFFSNAMAICAAQETQAEPDLLI